MSVGLKKFGFVWYNVAQITEPLTFKLESRVQFPSENKGLLTLLKTILYCIIT